MTDLGIPASEVHRLRRLGFLLGVGGLRSLMGPQLRHLLQLLNLEAEALGERPRDQVLVSAAPQQVEQKVRLRETIS